MTSHSSVWRHAPLRLTFRFDPNSRRLFVYGTTRGHDLYSIASLVRRGLIPADVNAIIYTNGDMTEIVRGRRLGLLIGTRNQTAISASQSGAEARPEGGVSPPQQGSADTP